MNRIKRLFFIYFIFFRYGLDEVVFFIPFLTPFRFLSYLNPWNWFHKPHASRGKRIRIALEKLGPVFVKFGQMLSTRPDLIPSDILKELARLQDRVPPFPADTVKKIIEKTYKKPLNEMFKEINTLPLASASVAQVHAATLWSNEDVVVKIIRPGIEKKIYSDVALLYTLARTAQRWHRAIARFKPVELVAELERTLIYELDLRRESANASQLRRNFVRSHKLYVPEVYWDYTEKNVMVLERIYGIPVAHSEALREQGYNFQKLAELGVEIFFTQVFKHNFFHADMHPGNIFVTGEPEHPKYAVVDFGIMGTLTTRDQRYLAENLLAFFKRDYRRVAELHLESGWIAEDVRLGEFEAAMRTVCEPMFEKPLREISFGQMLLQLIQTAKEFKIEIQPQLMLLQKTLVSIEGLARQLYPDLDLWKTAKPFLEHWVKEQLGLMALFRKIKNNLPYWAEKLPDMPDLIYNALQPRAATHKPPVIVKITPPYVLLSLCFVLGVGIGVLVVVYLMNIPVFL